jgi:hypothetical protein
MKQIYSSPDSAQVGFIQSLLQAADISCEVRNEAVSQVMVGIQFAPELWVRDEDYDQAVRLVTESHSQ